MKSKLFVTQWGGGAPIVFQSCVAELVVSFDEFKDVGGGGGREDSNYWMCESCQTSANMVTCKQTSFPLQTALIPM